MIRDDSPRLGHGNETLEKMLRDLDLRIAMLERAYIGDRKQTGVSAVTNTTQLPSNPSPGDMAKDMSTGTVYTADALGVWNVGGTIP